MIPEISIEDFRNGIYYDAETDQILEISILERTMHVTTFKLALLEGDITIKFHNYDSLNNLYYLGGL